MGLFFLCRSTFAHDGGPSVSKATQSYPTIIFGLFAATQQAMNKDQRPGDCEGGWAGSVCADTQATTAYLPIQQ